MNSNFFHDNYWQLTGSPTKISHIHFVEILLIIFKIFLVFSATKKWFSIKGEKLFSSHWCVQDLNPGVSGFTQCNTFFFITNNIINEDNYLLCYYNDITHRYYQTSGPILMTSHSVFKFSENSLWCNNILGNPFFQFCAYYGDSWAVMPCAKFCSKKYILI